MPSLDYLLVLALSLVTFSFSTSQIKAALEQEDLEAVCLWLCLAGFGAGLPLFVAVALTKLM
jgi:hypothetical protein